MKAISVLGTSSNSGKSWFATALCALLRRKGLSVAPFKAQNMSNNSFVTLDGGEIGRAQAAQAEACGLQPTVEMNPILLKPSGRLGSQLVLLGRAREHVESAEYYRLIEKLWPIVCETLEYWRKRCDVLVLEGAGSPVELNLMSRDIVNLRPIRHLDGKWVLVADIERGGVFAQIVGTWNLLGRDDQARGLGVAVNKFRGDLSLFADARDCLAEKTSLPYLGVLPFSPKLQPESEDSLCREAEERGDGDTIAWIRFPHLSNSQDCQPWLVDSGVRVRWVQQANDVDGAKIVVLPGSKNTVADLQWLHETGIEKVVKRAAQRGVPIVGICAGYQMLGESVRDPEGIAGDRGVVPGLNLLPVQDNILEGEGGSPGVCHRGGGSDGKPTRFTWERRFRPVRVRLCARSKTARARVLKVAKCEMFGAPICTGFSSHPRFAQNWRAAPVFRLIDRRPFPGGSIFRAFTMEWPIFWRNILI